MAGKSRKRRKRRAKAYALRTLFAVLCITFILIILFFAWKIVGGVISPQKSVEQDTIIIEKNGSIKGVICEDFDQDYYNADELQEMLSDEINQYAGVSGSAQAVQQKKFQVKNQKAYVTLLYATDADYRSFNEKEIYIGKINDLLTQNVMLNQDLISTQDDGTSVPATQISTLGDAKAVVIEEQTAVQTPGAILYHSNNVTLTGKKSATTEGDAENLAIIIYK